MKFHKIIMNGLALLLSLILISITLTACNPERNDTYWKEITTKDVLVEKSSNSLYFSFIVRPQVTVNNLHITIGFYDKNDFPVGARIKQIGAVIKGQEYHIEFNNSDFTTTELLAIAKYRYLEANGTIYGIKQETKGICFEHKYDDGFVNKQSTCYLPGEKIYTCTTCGYKKTGYIERTKHNWVTNRYSDMKYICTQCCCRADAKFE